MQSRIRSGLTTTVLLACLGAAPGALADNLYVAPCGNDFWTGADPGCVFPTGPKQTIQAAIDAASDGDEIFVLPGVYEEMIDLQGKAITLQAPGGADVTIIDGGGVLGPLVTCNSLEGADTIIRGFTIRNGENDHDAGGTGVGAGMFIALASPTIEECVFAHSHSSVRGGAVAATVASPAFISCSFIDNSSAHSAGGSGGAVSMRAGLATFTDCTFHDNNAFFRGGAVYMYDNAWPTFTDCNFTSNYMNTIDNEANSTDTYFGGAVAVVDSHPTFESCFFSSNDSSSRGAAAGVSGGTVTFNTCTFQNNDGDIFGDGYGGAVALRNQADAAFFGCQFFDNASTEEGAAIFAHDSSFTATLCGFLDNFAEGDTGGAVSGLNADMAFELCTFNGNNGPIGGGAIEADGGSLHVEGSTFSNNIGAGGGVGGAIYGVHTAFTLLDCAFIDNVSGWGGAIYITGNAPGLIEACSFNGNEATTTYGGAGILWSTGVIDIRDSVVMNNTALEVGGGFFSAGPVRYHRVDFTDNFSAEGGGVYHSNGGIPGQAIISACEFDGNGASERGAAIITAFMPTRIENTIIHHSVGAINGGAVVDISGSMLMTNSVVANNAVGGVVVNEWAESTIANSIIWSNLGLEVIGDPNLYFTTVDGGAPGVGVSTADPLFTNMATGDYRLQPGSPCIDAGANHALPVDTLDLDADGVTSEILPLDADGAPRFADADADDAGCGLQANVDHGAYEFEGVIEEEDIIPADLNDDGVVDPEDLVIVLAAWGPCEHPCCIADFDLDGVVGPADLVYLLARWTP